MALQKTIILPNTTSGTYIRIGERRISDPNASDRIARAHFNLFADAAAAAAAPDAPISLLCCLTLSGDRYDAYFSKTAMEAAGWNYTAQFYAALKNAATGHNPSEVSPGGGMTMLDLTDAANV